MDDFLPTLVVSSLVLVALSVLGTAYLVSRNDNETIASLISKGVSPLEARCAIRPDDRQKECFTLILEKNK